MPKLFGKTVVTEDVKETKKETKEEVKISIPTTTSRWIAKTVFTKPPKRCPDMIHIDDECLICIGTTKDIIDKYLSQFSELKEYLKDTNQKIRIEEVPKDSPISVKRMYNRYYTQDDDIITEYLPGVYVDSYDRKCLDDLIDKKYKDVKGVVPLLQRLMDSVDWSKAGAEEEECANEKDRIDKSICELYGFLERLTPTRHSLIENVDILKLIGRENIFSLPNVLITQRTSMTGRYFNCKHYEEYKDDDED